jgi:hypothetical protein
MIRGKVQTLPVSAALVLQAALAGSVAAQSAGLGVNGLVMPPGRTAQVTVFGEIKGEVTFGVTILVELSPRAGSVGSLAFTPVPPSDISQIEDPWPGAGTFSPFDTWSTGSDLLNGAVDDNGTFLPANTIFQGPLASFPVTASDTAWGVWDVLLATSVGDSGWEGVPTILGSATITVSPWACWLDEDCNDGNPCTVEYCDEGVCEMLHHGNLPCPNGPPSHRPSDNDPVIQVMGEGEPSKP